MANKSVITKIFPSSYAILILKKSIDSTLSDVITFRNMISPKCVYLKKSQGRFNSYVMKKKYFSIKQTYYICVHIENMSKLVTY